MSISLSSRARTLTAALLAVGLVLVVGSPAHAASYTWWNANTPSGVTKLEPSSSTSKQRSGVTAVSAAGNAAAVTAWLGSHYSTSSGNASVGGPLGYQATKAKWVSWLYPGGDTAKLTISITRPGPGAMRASGEDFFSSFEPVNFKSAQIWTEKDDAGVRILIERDGYRAESSATWEEYESNGVSVLFGAPSGPIQAHAFPDVGIASEEFSSNGLVKVAEGLYVSDPGRIAEEIELNDGVGGVITIFKFAATSD